MSFTPATMHGSQVGMKKELKFVPSLPQNLSTAGHSIKGGTKFVPTQALGLYVGDDPQYKFVPSVFGMIDRSAERFKKSYTLDWWTENSIFRYNSLLVSAYYGMDVWDFREHYKIPPRKDGFLFVADSGGWQIASQQVKIDPLEILRWQEHNADVGFLLDVPPVEPGTYMSYVDFNKFKDCATMAKRNYEIVHSRRRSNDLELLKPIHGGTMKELNYFWDVVKDLEFEGVAFSPKPATPMTIALELCFGYNKGVDIVHLFTGTGLNTIPVVVYARKMFERLTFDSSSFSVQGARFRSYCNPYYLSSGITFGRGYQSTLDKLPCDCPVCSLATVDDLNSDGSLAGGLIALHNLWTTLKYINHLTLLSESYTDYVNFLRVYSRDEDTIKAIGFINCVLENDLDHALKEYGITDSEDARNVFV